MLTLTLTQIIAHAKEYAFVFPSSELYDGLSAVYDFGPLGAQLKRNLRDLWWRSMVELRDDVVGLDTAIFMHPTIWKASGHVDNFADPLIDNKTSKKRYRVDHLIETYVAKLDDRKVAEELLARMEALLAEQDFAGLHELILQADIRCPVSGTADWSEVRNFNLMFATEMGSVSGDGMQVYLRPETAQGIFVNFLQVQQSMRLKIPFGIAQIGKAFRNEIVARQFIFRMREFEQMEMQFFIAPGTQAQWFEYWQNTRLNWLQELGLHAQNLSIHPHQQLAHYADKAVDINFQFPFGIRELEGIHSRTDYDLRNHSLHSNKKITYFDPASNQHYTPYVVECSIGLERLFLAVFSQALCQEELADEGNNQTRMVLKLPAKICPRKIAVLPLVKKEILANRARQIYENLRGKWLTAYDEKDSIGKRYRRQDAVGTPFCVTVDYDGLEDDTVTIRHRDSMRQERVSLGQLEKFLQNELGC